MSESIHGHRVMEMMVAAATPYTKETLVKAIYERFGTEARFHTCSAENMTAHELIEFLDARGKFFAEAGGFSVSPESICDHE